MGHLRIALIALAILAAGALAACGDDDEETTVTETVAEETTGSETGGTETGAAEDTETLPADARIGPSFFSTPSGNIACHLSAKAVRCDIAKKDWKPTPPEEPCELDYGN